MKGKRRQAAAHVEVGELLGTPKWVWSMLVLRLFREFQSWGHVEGVPLPNF